ncbi:DinB family protein [Leptospira inadai serovar Lyme str. 10]|uniref:DinB family protein n=2 Tax=Leptospira inadai serovar Lyme TaxID=293084 RepID=V6HEK2_9LEPT|nr:DinB family protein [Leptospira inadai]EQA37788.1 DinB family protein [Leptospira inadai serovar Lyme str. 10]PNV75015.1 damage-inducible protein DinB [Leptospira inadai serovar Lyme]
MVPIEYCKAMSLYNRWQNDSLLIVCASLKAEELEADKKLFFGSIANTWNHLILMDLAWLDRLQKRPVQITNFKERVFSSFDELAEKRRELDKTISNWAGEVSSEFLMQDLTFYSFMYAKEATLPVWLLVTHFFNHQTHHRSQISTALFQSGFDYGVTDIPWNPIYHSGS